MTIVQSERKKNSDDSTTVNWPFVRYTLLIMIVPKLAGVIGLLMLPTDLMNIIIFTLITGYALTYIFDKPLQSNSRTVDVILLAAAAYISGTSLIGGPLVIAVALRHIKPHEFRNTLFMVWWILVSIKLNSLCDCRRRYPADQCIITATLCRRGSSDWPQISPAAAAARQPQLLQNTRLGTAGHQLCRPRSGTDLKPHHN